MTAAIGLTLTNVGGTREVIRQSSYDMRGRVLPCSAVATQSTASRPPHQAALGRDHQGWSCRGVI